MHATLIRHNSSRFFDEPLPPKAERIIDPKLAADVLVAATMSAKRCFIPRKRVLDKRKGGEEGRFLRGFLIYYTRGLGAPVWMTSLIIGLDRKQIGQEEAAFLDMIARNQELEEEVEHLTGMCDHAIRFNPKRFIRHGLAERMADAAAKKAVKTVREAADVLEVSAPKPPPKPKVQTEVERIQAEANARHKAEARKQAEGILRRVIEVGSTAGATKEQKKDAERALTALKELDASAKKAKR